MGPRGGRGDRDGPRWSRDNGAMGSAVPRAPGPRGRQRSGGGRAWTGIVAGSLALVILVLVPAGALAVRVRPQRPAAGPLPWLSVRGGVIVDGRGREVLLRGFNDDELLRPAQLPSALTAQDAALIQAEGFDVVRLPIAWSRLEPRPGQLSHSYLNRIVRLVRLCAAHRLYTVIDMHTEDFGPAFGGIGAPRWLRVPLVPNLQLPGLGAAWRRHLSPAVNAALAAFWLTPGWQNLYWGALAQVARRLRPFSGVAGYDLYNEPHPLPIPPALFETRILWPFYARGIARIARADPNHLFIVEGELFGGLPTAIRPLHAPDLVYSLHLYAGSLLPPAFGGSAAPLWAELSQGLRESRRLPAAYWTGELGIARTVPRAESWARAELRLANRARVGWAWWQWADAGSWSVDAAGGRVAWSWLRVLAQPYPTAAPGHLRSVVFRDGQLSVTLDGVPPGAAPLQLAWPAWLGPPRVDSLCARPQRGWTWATGSLSLRLTRPRCTVTVRSAGASPGRTAAVIGG